MTTMSFIFISAPRIVNVGWRSWRRPVLLERSCALAEIADGPDAHRLSLSFRLERVAVADRQTAGIGLSLPGDDAPVRQDAAPAQYPSGLPSAGIERLHPRPHLLEAD